MSVLKHILFPPRCVLCAQILPACSEAVLCEECSLEPYRFGPDRCRICSGPLPEGSGGGAVCAACLMHGSTVPGRALYQYTGGVRESIHRFKYQDQWSYAKAYAQLAVEEDPQAFEDAAVLVPIPIHPRRARTRGYNQALVLAQALSKETGIPVADVLQRTRATAVQNQLSSHARRENIHGAFAVIRDAETILKKYPEGDILLIDDIYTSGSTIEEAARTLEPIADGKRVRFFTLALKTVSPQQKNPSESEKTA